MATQLQQRHRYLALIVVCLVVIVAGNYYYRKQLYQLGEEMIINFQSQENILLTTMMIIPTILIDPSVVIGIAFTLIIIIKQKKSSFATVVWILLNAFLACLLKAYYSDPRPFWSQQSIKSIGIYCPVEYGNPSGHSWFSVTVGMGFLVDKFGPGNNNRNIYISLILMIIVPISRMYLGAHSLNQVLQGVCLGLAMLCLYQFCGLKQKITQYLNNFHCEGNKWKKLTILIHLLYIIPFAINYYNHNHSIQQQVEQQVWTKRIEQKCLHTPTTGYLNFAMLMLNSIIVNFTTGIAYGYEQITQSQKGHVYLKGDWLINQQRYTLFTGYLMFVIIELGLMLVAFIPLGLVIYLIGTNQIILFFSINICVFLAGYLYTSKTFKLLFDKQIIREQVL